MALQKSTHQDETALFILQVWKQPINVQLLHGGETRYKSLKVH